MSGVGSMEDAEGVEVAFVDGFTGEAELYEVFFQFEEVEVAGDATNVGEG